MDKKVLIVEDYPATSEMIASILESEGIKTIIAPDGPAGLEKARLEKPDLILLDIMMPEMSGFDVAQKLKADSATAQIPIFFVTVRATDESMQRGKELGADEYITKPFDPFKLIETIKARLGA